MAGLPVVTDEGVRLEPPSWAKRLHAAQAGYLFLDGQYGWNSRSFGMSPGVTGSRHTSQTGTAGWDLRWMGRTAHR